MLNAVGYNHLFYLGYRNAERTKIATRKEVLGKLLTYGAAATLIAVEHKYGAEKHSPNTFIINAFVLVESTIFCGYEGIEHTARNVGAIDA